MNIFSLMNRGIANSGLEARKQEAFSREMEAARAKWLDSLMVDETRAWMSIGEQSREILQGLSVLLVLAGLCQATDKMHVNTVENRVIRGAISSAQQCAREGCRITAQHAQAFSSAAAMARKIFETCSHTAMAQAATYLEKTTQEIFHADAIAA